MFHKEEFIMKNERISIKVYGHVISVYRNDEEIKQIHEKYDGDIEFTVNNNSADINIDELYCQHYTTTTDIKSKKKKIDNRNKRLKDFHMKIEADNNIIDTIIAATLNRI